MAKVTAGKEASAAPVAHAAPRPILLHVHDWLGLFAGRALKYRYHLPMLSTIHATEYGRNSGIHTEMQRYINQCEWDLQWESWRVIVCSAFMRGEVGHALQTPWDKIDIVYNGVETGTFDLRSPTTSGRLSVTASPRRTRRSSISSGDPSAKRERSY